MSSIRAMPETCRFCRCLDMFSDGIRIWCSACGNHRQLDPVARRDYLWQERIAKAESKREVAR